MNNARRERLINVIAPLEELKDELESIKNDEQKSQDNLPYCLKPSSRIEAFVVSLDSCISELGDIIEELDEIVSR